MGFAKVLIAVDEDPIAAHAAEVGMELARALKAQVALIHTIDPSALYAPESGIGADELALSAQRDGTRMMTDMRSRLGVGTEALQFIVKGSAAHEIAAAAREWGADVIVIGSHGRRGVTRALLGSVAEAVMRHASCPVLVVRARE